MTPLFGTNCGNCKDYIEQYYHELDAVVEGAMTNFRRLIREEYAGIYNTDKTEEERMDHMKELCQEVQQHIATKKDNMLNKLREQIVSLKSLGDAKDGFVKKIEKEILEQEQKWVEQYATMEATVADLEEDVKNLSSQLLAKDKDWTDTKDKLADVTEEVKVLRDELQAANEDSVRDKKKIQELDEEAGPLKTELAAAHTALLATQKANLQKNQKISEIKSKLENAEKIAAAKDQVIKQIKKTAEENAKEIQDLKEEKMVQQKKSEDDELVMEKLKELLEQAEDNEKKRKETEELGKVRRRERLEERKRKKDRKMKRKLEKHEKKWGPIKMMKTDDEKEICDPSDSGCSTP
ncbi:hypothetical protein GCK72_006991 [Caenorhabditis remanei]|uniref:Uncharacterized protein n=1 Tax=Caenorhabditis remanei TaxID=31234 RepID=A0A6A5HKX1_CAERE|nr:hypothetical protein GCK72_006991 [Caenorhabditis remanei]KAF1767033.1 hypothetical protein GCK72_006991 [Caenorhabditis remanei]